MEKSINPAPCHCLPDHIISAVAQVAEQRGGGFDETLTFLVLLGIERQAVGEAQQEGGVLKGIFDRVSGFFRPAPDTPPNEGNAAEQAQSQEEGSGAGGEGATGGGLPPPAKAQLFRVGQSVVVLATGAGGKVLTAGMDEDGEWVYQVRLSGGVAMLGGDALRGVSA